MWKTALSSISDPLAQNRKIREISRYQINSDRASDIMFLMVTNYDPKSLLELFINMDFDFVTQIINES